jgi:NAD-dependent DNA ligase
MKASLNEKQTVVCMTGFMENSKLHLYREQINRLGCKYIEQLAEGTDILLVGNVSTEKYKVTSPFHIDSEVEEKYD